MPTRQLLLNQACILQDILGFPLRSRISMLTVSLYCKLHGGVC